MVSVAGYQPGDEAIRAHKSLARIRCLIWGIKSGKTEWGACEIVRFAMKNSNKLAWCVSSSFNNLGACFVAIKKLLDYYKVGYKYKIAEHAYHLTNGSIIACRSGDQYDNLRGPNVDFLWIDEAAYVKEEAWFICEDRLAATEGDIILTTTTDTRNWIWDLCLDGGMPPSMEYGVFQSKGENGKRDHRYFISHWPTWHFPWVSEEWIANVKKKRPRSIFDRDIGALFTSHGTAVFNYLWEALSRAPLVKSNDAKYVIGLDLAKEQDFTVLTIMDGDGRVFKVLRFQKIDYRIQVKRIAEQAKLWNACVVLDKANVGNVIQELLREEKVQIQCVDMNSSEVKTSLIQSLQIAFENKSIKLIDPKSLWGTREDKQMYEELGYYATKLTPGRKQLSYGAPSGFHDDCVVSIALANWGRVRGFAGGGMSAQQVAVGVKEWEALLSRAKDKKNLMRPRNLNLLKRYYDNKTRLGFKSGGTFWR